MDPIATDKSGNSPDTPEENDTVTGGAQWDSLFGNEDNDLLRGGSQDDGVNGGSGQDVLKGGSGGDGFIVERITDSDVGAVDKIVDFKGRDGIDRSQIDADTAVSGDQAFHFISSKTFTGTSAGELIDTKGIVMGDVDGDGQADFAIQMMHHPAHLNSRDFKL